MEFSVIIESIKVEKYTKEINYFLYDHRDWNNQKYNYKKYYAY